MESKYYTSITNNNTRLVIKYITIVRLLGLLLIRDKVLIPKVSS